MGEEGWIVIIAIIVGVTLIFGIRAILITWHNCVALGSTKDFFSDIWNGTAGNIFVILGLLILCVPVYIILSSVISAKKKKVSYRAEVRYNSDTRYREAFDQLKKFLGEGMDEEQANNKVIDQLVNQGANRSEAEESVLYYRLLLALQKMQ